MPGEALETAGKRQRRLRVRRNTAARQVTAGTVVKKKKTTTQQQQQQHNRTDSWCISRHDCLISTFFFNSLNFFCRFEVSRSLAGCRVREGGVRAAMGGGRKHEACIQSDGSISATGVSRDSGGTFACVYVNLRH